MKNLCLISWIVFVLGCAGIEEKMPEPGLIKMGMTRMEVRKIMGPPENWQSRGKDEAWQYCKTNRFSPLNDLILIWFHDRRVTGVNTYRNVGFGACDLFFKTIDWEDAPRPTKGL
ncbi:MAG: hypothetical protein JRH18_19105 [Deltaproteobacteria bacterium]|nr:hypothetical protein [Deltaproteobacteria bacterium]MBW1960830.1 hypothetical protein [Deltaproteobacteria bacterium]MBW1995737.1 hypothetical protein [Deltaproteobacteria bacterium]MBW2153763.1 hypothetical protein [Deltaproteobacteria bacterium]